MRRARWSCGRAGRAQRGAKLLAATLTAFLLGPPVPPTQAAAKPNIVFVMADDMDWDATRAMPRLREVAQNGTLFSRAYVSSPLCAPSRATILTGRYPQNTGVRRNRPPHGGFETFHAQGNESSTIAVWLRRAGYRTGLIGKYLNQFPNTAPAGYIPPGWDYWVGPKGGNYMYSAWDYYLNENGRIVFYPKEPGNYVTDVYARKGVEFIDSSVNRGEPFALFFWAPAPHAPVVPAPRHEELFPDARTPRSATAPETFIGDKPPFLRFAPPDAATLARFDRTYRGRLQMMAALDEAIGSLRARLAALGVLDDTYFVFFSDNGWHQAFHNLEPWKGTAFEEDIRVPLIVTGPGVPKGRTVGRLIGNADLAPTFATWAGAAAPADLDGRSFAGLLTAADPAVVPWRERLPLYRLTETVPGPTDAWRRYAPRPGLTTGYSCLQHVPDWRPVGTDPVNLPEFRGVRTERYTYVEYSTGDLELYDTANQPIQERNTICSAGQSLRDSLHYYAERLATCRGAACRELESR